MMIKSRADYFRYLEADRKALRIKHRYGFFAWLFGGTWKYERLLRQREYIVNCKKGIIWKPWRILNKLRLDRLGRKLGIEIRENSFGEGLCIAHAGPIVVNADARIGRFCEINMGVNIGIDFDGKAPVIGDYCFLAPGAKVQGGIIIGDNVVIGANAVVTKSFEQGECALVGVPAHAIPLKHPEYKMDRYNGK